MARELWRFEDFPGPGSIRVQPIGRNELDAILERFPDAARRLLDLVGQRFFHVLTDLEGTLLFGLVSRTARLLLERADGNRIQNITHKEIAEHLHVYRESATQALGALRRAGIITVGRKEIRILHRDRLERAACVSFFPHPLNEVELNGRKSVYICCGTVAR